MQIKIYDEVDEYEVDTINLENYDLDDELLSIISEIIENYQQQQD